MRCLKLSGKGHSRSTFYPASLGLVDTGPSTSSLAGRLPTLRNAVRGGRLVSTCRYLNGPAACHRSSMDPSGSRFGRGDGRWKKAMGGMLVATRLL